MSNAFRPSSPHTTHTQVRRLLEKGCADLDKGDKFGQTPLHIACHREGLLGCLKLLAAHHVNMKAFDANGNTALHSAAGSGAAAAAEFLLGRGLSVGDRNKDGHTPMVREQRCRSVDGRFLASSTRLLRRRHDDE